MRQTQLAQRTRAAVAAAWLRNLFIEQRRELALRSDDTELAEAVDEANALYPAAPDVQMATVTERVRYKRILLMALILVTVGVVTLFPPYATPGRSYCTFPSGTVVEGECMFEDTFSGALDTTVWHAINDWSGPLQAVEPDVGCFREENVTVTGGNLVLRMSVNARGSCPTAWPTTAYYDGLYGAAGSVGHWPQGAATSYDVAVVDMKPGAFRMKYGFVEMRITLPPGHGPGGDVTLWGTDCQSASGSIAALSDLFTKAPGQRTCDWPNTGSGEMDLIQSATQASTLINTSTYVGPTPGSPPAMSVPYFGISYYGARWAQPATADFTTFIGGTITNPTTSFHVYRLEWTPDRWAILVDNNMVAFETPTPPTWILSHDAYMMLWNAATVPVTAAELPSDMLVDYIRIWCPTGTPCEWSGTAAL